MGERSYWVVTEWAWMNDSGHGIDRGWSATLPTLAAAKRWGLRHLGHDDFCIAIVNGDVMERYTWMGEDRGDTDDDLEEIARSLGLRYKPPVRAVSSDKESAQ